MENLKSKLAHLSPEAAERIQRLVEDKDFQLRVERLTEIQTKLEEERFQFGNKHGFVYKRPQNYKNCIVIRWKITRKKYEINHTRLNEYGRITDELSKKFDLYMEEFPLLGVELRLLKIGIYVSWSSYPMWAIPNEFKEIQDYVLSNLPKWVQVSVK
jgi:hypothetical protein